MANEIQVSTRLSWSKNGAQIIASIAKTIDQAGDQAIQNVQIIGTSSEQLVFGDVTTIGHLLVKNVSTSGTVYVGRTNPMTANDAEAVLGAGEGVYIPTNQASWYAIAAAGTVNLLVCAIEA